MKRRDFIAGLGVAVAWPLLVRAQQQTKPVIGYLVLAPGRLPEAIEAFRRGLAEVGFSEGRDVTMKPEWRRRCGGEAIHSREREEPQPIPYSQAILE
jgi:putative ABC transport system substrate-binding protein